MLRHFALVLVAAHAVAGARPEARLADVTDRVSRTVSLPASRTIQLDATIADLTIIGSNRPDVAIEIVRRAPAAADLERFPVAVTTTPDALRISVVQGNDERDANRRAEITVRAPASAIVRPVRVFEGRVRVSGLTADCDIELQRGAISAATLAGRIRLESGLGSVEVNESTLTSGGMMRLRVFNGRLRVRFARQPANARILAVTLNGAIASDIPLTTKDAFGPRFGETTLGTGDPVMSLDVVKGDISIAVDKR